ncbi:hypothetical protein BJ508DRAFT_305224 [Ascobolus immersus RN42]|uniref:Uncharacterized protein n=1 Tax=Ascobolus immersus RN42 TaxID=1160509 RepID=A0A3N4IBV2_ASCIM|nr:hypothetical protein BJ508DRAFT_305224 [Ascobolus immersus RN42]
MVPNPYQFNKCSTCKKVGHRWTKCPKTARKKSSAKEKTRAGPPKKAPTTPTPPSKATEPTTATTPQLEETADTAVPSPPRAHRSHKLKSDSKSKSSSSSLTDRSKPAGPPSHAGPSFPLTQTTSPSSGAAAKKKHSAPPLSPTSKAAAKKKASAPSSPHTTSAPSNSDPPEQAPSSPDSCIIVEPLAIFEGNLKYHDIEVGQIIDALVTMNPWDDQAAMVRKGVYHPCLIISKNEEHGQITGNPISSFGQTKFKSGKKPKEWLKKKNWKWLHYSCLPLNDTSFDPHWALSVPTQGKKTIGYLFTANRSYIHFRKYMPVAKVRLSYKRRSPSREKVTTTVSAEALKYVLEHGRAYHKSNDGLDHFDRKRFERRALRLASKMKKSLKPRSEPATGSDDDEWEEYADGEEEDADGDGADAGGDDGGDSSRKRKGEDNPDDESGAPKRQKHIFFEDDGSSRTHTAAKNSEVKKAEEEASAYPTPTSTRSTRSRKSLVTASATTLNTTPAPKPKKASGAAAFTEAYMAEAKNGRFPRVEYTLYPHGSLSRAGVEEMDPEVMVQMCYNQSNMLVSELYDWD